MGIHNISPDSSVPPPPSPPCTCGKVLGDMGPPPPPDPWDSQSIDSRITATSKGTVESRRSQGRSKKKSISIDVHSRQLPGRGGFFRLLANCCLFFCKDSVVFIFPTIINRDRVLIPWVELHIARAPSIILL